MPSGYGAVQEARLETFGPMVLPKTAVWSKLRTWWLAHERGANTPNWDLAVGCEVEGAPGLILVEAKGNVPELSSSGKRLSAAASAASRENHAHIAAAIRHACDALGSKHAGVAITRDSHYQMSNRMAFAWKLANLGIPTVLVYLGFLGDEGIADAGEPFRDADHWTQVFEAYAGPVVPPELFERRLECGAAAMWVLVRSKPVIQVSAALPSGGPRRIESVRGRGA